MVGMMVDRKVRVSVEKLVVLSAVELVVLWAVSRGFLSVEW